MHRFYQLSKCLHLVLVPSFVIRLDEHVETVQHRSFEKDQLPSIVLLGFLLYGEHRLDKMKKYHALEAKKISMGFAVNLLQKVTPRSDRFSYDMNDARFVRMKRFFDFVENRRLFLPLFRLKSPRFEYDRPSTLYRDETFGQQMD